MTDCGGDVGDARRIRSDRDVALQRFLDDLAIATAGDQRLGRRWLHQMAGEELTLSALLVDLAAGGVDVTVETFGGRTWWGSIRAVGRDFLTIDTGGEGTRGPLFVPRAAITAVRAPMRSGGSGGGHGGADLTFSEALAAVAPERPDVQVWRRDAAANDPLDGRLLAAGPEVLALRTANGDVFVPADAVAAVALAT